MPVEFKDYSIKVTAALNDTTNQWLYEMGNEIASHANRNCKMDGDAGKKLRGSYQPAVDEGAGEAKIGSPQEAVYWEEFGTGSHAAHGDGRKGWWVYVKSGETRKRTGATYATREEAEAVAESMRRGKKKLDAYATNGREPNYTLEKAFETNRAKAQRRLEQILSEGMK